MGRRRSRSGRSNRPGGGGGGSAGGGGGGGGDACFISPLFGIRTAVPPFSLIVHAFLDIHTRALLFGSDFGGSYTKAVVESDGGGVPDIEFSGLEPELLRHASLASFQSAWCLDTESRVLVYINYKLYTDLQS